MQHRWKIGLIMTRARFALRFLFVGLKLFKLATPTKTGESFYSTLSK